MTNEPIPLKPSEQPAETQVTPQPILHESLPQLKAALASCQKWISYSSPEYHRFATFCFWAMISAGTLFMSLTVFVWQPASAGMESIKHWCVMLWWGLWVTGFVWKYFQLPKGWPANSPIAAQVARHRWSIAFFLVVCVYFASLEWLDGSGSEPLHIIMGVLICWFGGLVRHWSHDSKLLAALLHFTNQADRLTAMKSDETGIDPTRLLAASLQDVIGELEPLKRPPEFEVREYYADMSGTTGGVRFGVGRVLGTLIGVGLVLVLAAGLLILADNLTITLFSIEIGGWGIWQFCWLYYGTIACTKLGLSAFSEQGMPLSKKRRITGPGVRCIGVIILSLNAAVIVGYLYILFERFM